MIIKKINRLQPKSFYVVVYDLLIFAESMKLISGAVVEGWKWGQDGGPDKEWTDTVTHYSVEFGPDGRLWTLIKDEYGLPRVSYYCHTSSSEGFMKVGAKWKQEKQMFIRRPQNVVGAGNGNVKKTVCLLSKTKTLQVRHAVWLFRRRHCSITT